MRWRRGRRKAGGEDGEAEAPGVGASRAEGDAAVAGGAAPAAEPNGKAAADAGPAGGGKGAGARPKREMHIDMIRHDVANLVVLPVVSSIGLLGLAGVISPRHSTFTIFFYILVDLIWILKRPDAIPNLYAVIVTHHLVVLLLVRPRAGRRRRSPTRPPRRPR